MIRSYGFFILFKLVIRNVKFNIQMLTLVFPSFFFSVVEDFSLYSFSTEIFENFGEFLLNIGEIFE